VSDAATTRRGRGRGCAGSLTIFRACPVRGAHRAVQTVTVAIAVSLFAGIARAFRQAAIATGSAGLVYYVVGNVFVEDVTFRATIGVVARAFRHTASHDDNRRYE